MAHTPEAERYIARLQRRSMANMFVLGVDRLDYTKGLPDRMRAFRRLLELHPERMQKGVTFMQIAPPTREEVEAYTEIRQELEGLSGSINGEFGDFDWTPVRYIHRAMPRATLSALFRGSQVGLVTPLRDGMNLVAKEYVASQDPENPGDLVLSKFAGAAEDLKEAVLVNPYDTDEMADALFQALTMPLEERRSDIRRCLPGSSATASRCGGNRFSKLCAWFLRQFDSDVSRDGTGRASACRRRDRSRFTRLSGSAAMGIRSSAMSSRRSPSGGTMMPPKWLTMKPAFKRRSNSATIAGASEERAHE